MLPFWVDWDYFQGCGCSGCMCNAKSPYKISTARTNSSVMARRTQAEIFVVSHGYSNGSCWYGQDETFSHFYFSKVDRYFLPAISIFAGYFFWFWNEQKIKNNKICVMDNTSMDGPSGKLSIAGLRSKNIRAGSTAALIVARRPFMLHPACSKICGCPWG